MRLMERMSDISVSGRFFANGEILSHRLEYKYYILGGRLTLNHIDIAP